MSEQILQKFKTEFEGLIERSVGELVEDGFLSHGFIGLVWGDLDSRIAGGRDYLEKLLHSILDEGKDKDEADSEDSEDEDDK